MPGRIEAENYGTGGLDLDRLEFAPVSSGISQETYRVINENSGRALEVESGSTASGANVQQWTPNGSDAQNSRFEEL